jgi:hypothetical protein
MASRVQLESVGIDADALAADQRQVLEGLSEQEFTTLASVRARMGTAGGDVEAHMNGNQGAVFW